jgi:hypothetical protein
MLNFSCQNFERLTCNSSKIHCSFFRQGISENVALKDLEDISRMEGTHLNICLSAMKCCVIMSGVLIGTTLDSVQNLFITSACNIKRWLRIAVAALSGALLTPNYVTERATLFSVYFGNTPFRRDPCVAWRAFSRRHASHRERWLRCELDRSCLLL